MGQDQQQHREDEEVHVAEEAGEPGVVLVGHVSDRVPVNEGADAGDDQRHDHRQRVEVEVDGDLGHGAEAGPGSARPRVDDVVPGRGSVEEAGHRKTDESQCHDAGADPLHHRPPRGPMPR